MGQPVVEFIVINNYYFVFNYVLVFNNSIFSVEELTGEVDQEPMQLIWQPEAMQIFQMEINHPCCTMNITIKSNSSALMMSDQPGNK